MRPRDVGDHDGSAVATETIFEQSCQLRVSIWDIVILISRGVLVKGIDTVAKCQQGSIDVSAFDHTNTSIIRFRCSLRASKVDKRQLSHVNLCMDTRILVLMLTDDLEDCVGSR